MEPLRLLINFSNHDEYGMLNKVDGHIILILIFLCNSTKINPFRESIINK
jgi:hypothetical protein